MIQTKYIAEIFFKDSYDTDGEDFSMLVDALDRYFEEAKKVYELEDMDLVSETFGTDGNYIVQFYGFQLDKVTEFYNKAIQTIKNYDFKIKKLEYK